MYHKDTEPLYHSFMYSLISLLSGVYSLPAMHSLLVTLYVTEYSKQGISSLCSYETSNFGKSMKRQFKMG